MYICLQSVSQAAHWSVPEERQAKKQENLRMTKFAKGVLMSPGLQTSHRARIDNSVWPSAIHDREAGEAAYRISYSEMLR